MLSLVPPCQADRPANDEGSDGVGQGWRDGVENNLLGMSDGEDVLIVLDVANEPVAVLEEDGGGAKVVGRRVQAHDEASGEQVLTPHLAVRARVDEDVGEGSGRVANVAAPVEYLEQIANLTVDPRDLAGSVPNVDGGIVRLIIYEQHGLVYG